MRAEHECFPQPSDPEIRVWRYMDVAKFLALVQNQTLYFSRVDTLGDPFEGSVTRANHQLTEVIRGLRKQPSLRSSVPQLDAYFDLSDHDFDELARITSLGNKQNLKELFVSCWHMNEFESAAMWNQYGPKNSLCIQTTYNKLVCNLPDFVHVGMVKYIDYNQEIIPQTSLFYNVMHKRKSFEHEREVRAVHWGLENRADVPEALIERAGETGFKIKVDLRGLIERVFISPEAPFWFKPLVDNLLEKYELAHVAVASEMGGEPLY